MRVAEHFLSATGKFVGATKTEKKEQRAHKTQRCTFVIAMRFFIFRLAGY